ncbi:AAA family ATPase [Pedobacter endophyticus]|uniref:AAA family ATPase n=1 Tax=Pedobacter endophyticus TaxID=2789740 RepID=A0A7U3SQ56_9SPHI|nr:DUF3696 domain-containing protein [Pedobacter endophyticus]QPH38751.1 AAA family ATPase [Pedobacter endophyticus]
MINKLIVDNFKCFDKIEIDLKNLTLFCGTNSSGKSSAIQSLLLIDNCLTTDYSLNSHWLNLGHFEEIRNFIIRRERVYIEIVQEASLCKIEVAEDEIISSAEGNYKAIYYISANRVGPKDFYHKITSNKNFIGENAEFLIDYFYKNSRNIVVNERMVDNSSSTLDFHVNYWLNKILNVTIALDNIISGNIITANYSFKGNKNVRPYHVGAGTSYIIGILILCLNIEKGATVILENPEIHLHPKAQSELASFLAFIAKSGVQIIIETHSDHIFNGIRKAVYRNEICNDDISIQFFEMNQNNLSDNINVNLNSRGKILDVRDDLFDQFDNDLDELLGLV